MRRVRTLPALVASVLAGAALVNAQGAFAAEPGQASTTATSPANTSTAANTSDAADAAPSSAVAVPTNATPGPAPTASPAPANDVVTATPAPAPAPATTPGSTPPAAQPEPAALASMPPLEIPPPRLQLSAGFVFGPHALGEATCQSDDGISECQHRGNFLGAGATIELRGQLYKILYLHARGVVVGNVRRRPYAVHSGLAGGGLGLGVYSRLAFMRGEYLLIPAFGPDTYVPPFFDKQVARDRYGLHAGMISGGIHKYVTPRTALELWAGFIIGPRAERTSLSMQVNEKRVLKTFMVSVGFVFDLVLAGGHVPPPRQPRKRRVW